MQQLEVSQHYHHTTPAVAWQLEGGAFDEIITHAKPILLTEKENLPSLSPLPSQRNSRIWKCRNDFAKEWTEFAETEPEFAWKSLSSPSTVATLEAVMKRLSARKSKL